MIAKSIFLIACFAALSFARTNIEFTFDAEKAAHDEFMQALAMGPQVPTVGSSGLVFSNAFGDNMVLQRGTTKGPVVWGFVTSTKSVNVVVTFNGAKAQGASNPSASGFWSVTLPPMNATSVGQTLTASTGIFQDVKLKNVLVGDVYICGGQSNMQYTLLMATNGTDEAKNAGNYPNIRLFTVGQGTTSASPLAQFTTIVQPWTQASTAAVSGKDWTFFSGVCWYYGRALNEELNIPIGLISSNWGGTAIQAWMSPNALAQCPNVAPINGGGPNLPSVLYNAMLVPLLKTQVAGMIWYQGESNTGVYGGSAGYRCLFPTFISHLRTAMNQPVPFIFVQLSAWNYAGDDLPEMRFVQVDSTKGLPNVGYAVSIDIADPNSPYGDIHPTDKSTLGRRLAETALNVVYNNHMHSYKGPHPAYVAQNGTGIVIGFASSSMFPNIDLMKPNIVCGEPHVPNQYCKGFEVVTKSNSTWKSCSPPIANPNMGSAFFFIDCGLSTNDIVTSIRYMWASWGLSYFYNRGMRPAEPFTYNITNSL